MSRLHQLLEAIEDYRITRPGPFHIHTWQLRPLMGLQQCVVCPALRATNLVIGDHDVWAG